MSVIPRIELADDLFVASVRICRVEDAGASIESDVLAIESPLEIRLGYESAGQHRSRPVSVTMRTPGHDTELAVGFLFAEGIITGRQDIDDVRACASGNAVRVELRTGLEVDLDRLERHFYTTSSCGVCGKTSLEAVRVQCRSRPDEGVPLIDAEVIHELPAALRQAQLAFQRTGGLHAAALFDRHGKLQCLREDVGRHNAVDKVIGAQLLTGQPAFARAILFVSGRASFELVQKAAVAGIPILAAVGAPSSLAVELAHERGLTVLGFVSRDRFNIYSGPNRIREAAAALLSDTPLAKRTSLSTVKA